MIYFDGDLALKVYTLSFYLAFVINIDYKSKSCIATRKKVIG